MDNFSKISKNKNLFNILFFSLDITIYLIREENKRRRKKEINVSIRSKNKLILFFFFFLIDWLIATPLLFMISYFYVMLNSKKKQKGNPNPWKITSTTTTKALTDYTMITKTNINLYDGWMILLVNKKNVLFLVFCSIYTWRRFWLANWYYFGCFLCFFLKKKPNNKIIETKKQNI